MAFFFTNSEKEYPNNLEIAVFVFTLVVGILYVAAIVTIFLRAIAFRPSSFQSLEYFAPAVLIFETIFPTLLIVSTYKLDKKVQVIMRAISILFNIIGIIPIFLRAGYVQIKSETIILGGSIASILFHIYSGILIWVQPEDMPFNFSLVFLVIVIAVGFFIAHFIVHAKHRKHLLILDDYEETRTLPTHMCASKFANIIVSGYQYSHPTCVDFSFIKDGSDRWPKKDYIWFIYAKLASVFPERRQILSLIPQFIKTYKIKTRSARYIKQSIRHIQTSREQSLTQDLKLRIEFRTKQIQECKLKMRNIWDLALQDNTKYIQQATEKAYNAALDLERGLSLLAIRFPNNRFVARLLVKFYRELDINPPKLAYWQECAKVLQLGVNITQDRITKMGLYAFPNLSNTMMSTPNTPRPYTANMSSILSTIDENENDQNTANYDESRMDNFDMDDDDPATKEYFSELIMQHTPRLVTVSYIFICVLCVLMFILPCILLLGFYRSFAKITRNPLNHLYGILYMQEIISMIASFSTRAVMEYTMVDGEPFAKPHYLGISNSYLGYSENITIQLSNLVYQTSVANEFITFLREASGENELTNARKLMFETLHPFYFMVDSTQRITEYLTLETICQRIAADAVKLNQDKAIDSHTLTLWENAINTTVILEDVFQMDEAYITQRMEGIKLIIFIVQVCYSAFILILIIISFCLNVYFYSHDIQQVVQTFSSIPKDIIASISQRLSNEEFEGVESAQTLKLQKNTTSTTLMAKNSMLTKAEENILKIFSKISETNKTIQFSKGVFIIEIVCFILCIIINALLAQIYNDNCNFDLSITPDINFVLGTTSYINHIAFYMNRAVMGLAQIKDADINPEQSRLNCKEKIYTLVDFYQDCLFNQGASGIHTSSTKCEDSTQPTPLFLDNIECFDPRVQVYLYAVYTLKYMALLQQEGYVPDPNLHPNDLWYAGPILIYVNHLTPLIDQIPDEILDNEDKALHTYIAPIIIISIIGVVLSIFMIYYFVDVNNMLKFGYRSLLHCPASTIQHCHAIMNILHGNYSDNDEQQQEQKDFEAIVQNIKEPILIANQQTRVIEMANASFCNTFGESFIGKTINNFLSNENFSHDLVSALSQVGTCTIQYTKNQDILYFRLTQVNLLGKIVLQTEDITESMKKQKLINEETQKRRRLLATILPIQMLQRVMCGQHNIWFNVNTATILFIDIFNFHTIMGKKTPQEAFQFLEKLYSIYDEELKHYKSLTFVKSFNSDYMIAGGIFDECAQTQYHAKQAIDFLLACMHKVGHISNGDDHIEMRAGVQTSGPVIGGIIGNDKPVFEITGKPIGAAYNMLMSALPNTIHITRLVYEFIFSGSYNIRERRSENSSEISYYITI